MIAKLFDWGTCFEREIDGAINSYCVFIEAILEWVSNFTNSGDEMIVSEEPESSRAGPCHCPIRIMTTGQLKLGLICMQWSAERDSGGAMTDKLTSGLIWH